MEENNLSIEELRALAEKIFENKGKFPVISFLEGHEFALSDYSKLDNLQKTLALKVICHGRYNENQIAYMQIADDLSGGFALTTDAFCIGGSIGNIIFKYRDIVKAEFFGRNELLIFVNYKDYADVIPNKYETRGTNWDNEHYGYDDISLGWCYKFYGISRKIEYREKVKEFLDVVKNF